MKKTLDESCTLDEVHEAISYGDIEKLAEIPKHHQTEQVVFDWLEGLNWIEFDIQFDDLPLELRTLKIMTLAAKRNYPVLKHATPEQYAQYRSLAFSAIGRDPMAIVDLDPRFRDLQMIEYLQSCWPGSMNLVAQSCDWFFDLISDDLLNKSAVDSYLFALIAPQERLREPLYRYMDLTALSTQKEHTKIIRDCGRLDSLAEQVRRGEWFRNHDQARPKSLDEAVRKLKGEVPLDLHGETILLAYVMTHPIENVVPAMEGSRLKKLLIEMYPREALEPFVKIDVGLRGAMLEGALGL